jgi:hypothetical protein
LAVLYKTHSFVTRIREQASNFQGFYRQNEKAWTWTTVIKELSLGLAETEEI